MLPVRNRRHLADVGEAAPKSTTLVVSRQHQRVAWILARQNGRDVNPSGSTADMSFAL
jgi:hypothetical protein